MQCSRFLLHPHIVPSAEDLPVFTHETCSNGYTTLTCSNLCLLQRNLESFVVCRHFHMRCGIFSRAPFIPSRAKPEQMCSASRVRISGAAPGDFRPKPSVVLARHIPLECWRTPALCSTHHFLSVLRAQSHICRYSGIASLVVATIAATFFSPFSSVQIDTRDQPSSQSRRG